MKPATPTLSLVQPSDESPAARARRLQSEARDGARVAYESMIATLESAASQAADVAALGSLPPGVIQEAERIAPLIEKAVKHMTSIAGRVA